MDNLNIFMIVIFAFVGFASGYLCRVRTNTYLNSGSIFCFVWGCVGIFSNMGLYRVYLPSVFVNVTMLVSMVFVSMVYSILSQNRKINALYIDEMQCEIKSRIIYVINALIFIYIIPYFSRALVIIRLKGFIYLRSIVGIESQEAGTSSLSNFILQALCYPAIIATFIIGCILFFQRKKESKSLLIISFINLVLYCLTNAARNGFIVLVVIIVLGYLKYYRVRRRENIRILSKKEKFMTCVLIMACITVVIWISNERSSEGDSIIRTAYLYYFGGPAYLSKLLDNLLSYKINSTFLYGTSTFGFIWNLISLFSNRVGLSLINSDFVINSTLACRSLTIGANVKLNAMSTIFFPFLMDWGYLGLIIGPVLLGFFSFYVDRKTYWNNTIRWHGIQAFWFYVLYRSIFKWEGVSVSFFFTFFFIIIFTNKKVYEA